MVKPVSSDFEILPSSTNTLQAEPELSFGLLLKESIQKNDQISDRGKASAAVTAMEEGSAESIKSIKTNFTALDEERGGNKGFEGKEKSEPLNGMLAGRLHSAIAGSTGYNGKIIQPLVHSHHTNNGKAIAQDTSRRGNALHTLTKDPLSKIDMSDAGKASRTIGELNEIGGKAPIKNGQLLNDAIRRLENIMVKPESIKDSKNTINQSISNLISGQDIKKKSLNAVLQAQPAVSNPARLDNKKAVRDTSNAPEMSSNVTAGSIKQEFVLIDAVKQNSKAEDAPKTEMKLPSMIERNDQLGQFTMKQSLSINAVAESKLLMNEEMAQLLNKAKILKDGEKTTLSLKLHPESLGRLHVQLGLEYGVVSGRFIVESDVAREQLMRQLETIRLVLEQNGVNVGEFEVNVKQQGHKELTQQINSMSSTQNNEYEAVNIRYIYHDGLLDVII